jgi:hypothetical protein
MLGTEQAGSNGKATDFPSEDVLSTDLRHVEICPQFRQRNTGILPPPPPPRPFFPHTFQSYGAINILN